MTVVDRMPCKYPGVRSGGLANTTSMPLSAVNSPKAKTIFREDTNFNVMELSMKRLAKRVVNTNITPITTHEFSNKTKVSPPISFIVPANIGRLTFMVTLENTFKTANTTFRVVPWKRNVPDVSVVPFSSFWDLFSILFPIRGDVSSWFMLWTETRYTSLELDIFSYVVPTNIVWNVRNQRV